MTTTSELRSQLETKGEEISSIAHQIEDRIESYVDWPGIVREHPMESIGVAAVAGLILAGSAGSITKFVLKQLGTIVQAGITASVVAAITAKAETENQSMA
jgi:hypothetical protein